VSGDQRRRRCCSGATGPMQERLPRAISRETFHIFVKDNHVFPCSLPLSEKRSACADRGDWFSHPLKSDASSPLCLGFRKKRTCSRCRGQEWQGDGKTGPPSHLAFYGNRAAMRPDDPGDNRESQSTATASGLSAHRIRSIKTLKNMRQMFQCNAHARIAPGQTHSGSRLCKLDTDVSSRIGILLGHPVSPSFQTT